jgi:hypothetical protein
MTRIDTLLLLALPASGKSEIRHYLEHVDPEVAARDFHLGPTVQLDDYPYVQLMLVLDHKIRELGGDPLFFQQPSDLLIEGRDWGMLARLLAEDYAALGSVKPVPDRPTLHLLDRFDRARRAVGADPVTPMIEPDLLHAAATELDDYMAHFYEGLLAELGRYDDSTTVVVEFARGGPAGADCPLPPPHGYAYTLPHLGEDMLARSAILYVWVDPEDSRRRNLERAGPGPHEEASVLHHRVPDEVMRYNYGTDDLRWLIDQGAGAVEVPTSSERRRLPAAIFDNRRDYTSFLRADPDDWPADSITEIHHRLGESLSHLAGRVG